LQIIFLYHFGNKPHIVAYQCSSTGVPRKPSFPQKMKWGSASFKGSVRVCRFFYGNWFLASICWCFIRNFCRPPYRIQTPVGQLVAEVVECS